MLHFSPDAKRLLTTGDDGIARQWDLSHPDGGSPRRSYSLVDEILRQVADLPDEHEVRSDRELVVAMPVSPDSFLAIENDRQFAQNATGAIRLRRVFRLVAASKIGRRSRDCPLRIPS